MAQYLGSHPKVFVSDPKEPRFFSTDIVDQKPSSYKSQAEYLSIYSGATSVHLARGEASTCYLRSRVAVPRILEKFPDSKIVVMLRNPVDLVHAFHSTRILMGVEFEADFEQAWRRERIQVPAETPESEIESGKAPYLLTGKIGDQCSRLLNLVPRDNVHFIVFDDLIADPRKQYLGLLNFLGVPDDGRHNFPLVNENIRFKLDWLGRAPRYVREKFSLHLGLLKNILGVERFGVVRLLDRYNTRPAKRNPVSPEFREELKIIFADQVHILEKILERDLQSWLASVGMAEK